ncbi:tetratricopeptide repeat protein 19 homolog, mitochondrial [Lucilia cuprina]|uniref:tetratricopeptide repeat protein 19 homolog, mitochondrial n=1 Tax=Lucilia cuprina TaxID=7375 RepID=UPI001F057176|nr:tetratricopeptide repeat protein 19 homolog, mitochondrial [Lucilia cuprina]
MNFVFYRFPKTYFFNIFKLRANKFKNLCENKKVYNNVLNRKVYGDALFITYSVSILGLFKSDEETPENKLITTIKRSILCIQREQYDKAEQMLHLALRMSQDLQSKDGIIYVYDIMANLAMEREQYKKAERLFAEVMRRLLGDGLSEENTKILHISSKLAHIAQLQGDIEKAKTGFVWTLSKIEECRKKMPDDIDVKELWGLTTNWFGQLLMKEHNFRQAKQCFKDAYDCFTQIHGTDNEEALTILNNLSVVCTNMEQFDEARNYILKALELVKNIKDATQEGILLANLGLIYLREGLIIEAKSVCSQAWKSGKSNNNDAAIEQAEYCLNEIKTQTEK